MAPAAGIAAPWTLHRLTLVALYERPDMPIAVDKADIASAQVLAAGELPNPRLALAPTYNTTTQFPSPWKVGPIIEFVVNSVAERPARLRAAEAELASARQALNLTAWTLRQQVRSALLALWGAREQVDLSRSALSMTHAYRQVLAERARTGEASESALAAADLLESQAALRLAADKRLQALAYARLAAALDVPVAALRAITIDLAAFEHPPEPKDLRALQHMALIRRPDVLAALDRYRAAEARLRLAVLRQYPRISLGPGYHYDQGDNKFILALSLELPILNQNQGPIAKARAERRLAAAEFQAVQDRVLAEIGHAETDERATLVAVRAAHELMVAAQRTEQRAVVDFSAGATGRLSLLKARLMLISARRRALGARIQRRTALGALEDALHHRFL